MRTAADGLNIADVTDRDIEPVIPERRRIGAVDVAAVDQETALALVLESVAASEPAVYGFCNAHTANMARNRPDFAAALAEATVFPDGIGVDLASQFLHGEAFPANLNGTDFTSALLRELPAGTPVFLLGSPPGVADKAAQAIAAQYPGLVVAGSAHGFFEDGESPLLAARIRASGARVLLVGMGHPRQELWAAKWGRTTGAVTLCVGAWLDFTAGRVPRAPEWVRRARFEWVYRLMVEPRRLARRYLWGNFTFLAAVARQRMQAGQA